jgi:hypothetical protein
MENQLNLSKDELADFIKSVKTLLNLQLGNLKLKSIVRDNNNGMVFIFCDEKGNETLKKLNELVIRTEDIKNTTLDITSSDVPTPINNMNGGGFGFSETSSDVPKFKNSKKNNNKFNSDTFSLTSPMAPKSTFMKGGNNTNSDIYSQTSPMPAKNNMKGGSGCGTLSETSPMASNYKNMGLSETSYDNTNNNMRGGAMSETSPMPSNYKNMALSETSYDNTNNNMIGGAMSETSPMPSNYKNMVLSDTSSVMDNGIGIGMNISSLKGGKSSKKMYNQATSDIYSATSNLAIGHGQNNFRGGALTDSDTLNFTTESNLDTSIFKKPSSSNNTQQKGGSSKSGANNLRNQMKDMGIGSTSTSSVCE